tara:strand:- start:333 stop:1139 length:807 start_codon:yes stop_codon:yes gene_type:complete
MSEKILDLIPKIIKKFNIKTLDITGGAPEMNPNFKKLVLSLKNQDINIIDRCNLTIFFEKGYEDLPNFLAENKVIITASLPCYEKENVEKQRGSGVFDKSINAIKILNNLGYGKTNTELELNLVYNPINPTLPPAQDKLEKDYKKVLFEKYKITFNKLYTITNMPINRYADFLKMTGELEKYFELLAKNFNQQNLKNLMCKKTLSIDWEGQIYDCDFNQQLKLKSESGPKNLYELLNYSSSFNYPIAAKNHCFACTAGAGSSCGGSLS